MLKVTTLFNSLWNETYLCGGRPFKKKFGPPASCSKLEKKLKNFECCFWLEQIPCLKKFLEFTILLGQPRWLSLDFFEPSFWKKLGRFGRFDESLEMPLGLLSFVYFQHAIKSNSYLKVHEKIKNGKMIIMTNKNHFPSSVGMSVQS